MQSIDSLRELNSKLLAEIAELRKKSAEIPELKEKLLKFAKIEAGMRNQPINRATSDNTNIKSIEERETDIFLVEVYKKSVSNEIWQKNREKKLLHESAIQDSSSVTKKSQSHKKREAENIVQNVFDFTTSAPEKNHETEISMTGHHEKSDTDDPQRARSLFEKIGIDKIKYITTYSANSISELSDSQIQTIIDYFSENPNTELSNGVSKGPDQDSPIIDSEEEILNHQDNILEEQAKPLVSAIQAKKNHWTPQLSVSLLEELLGESITELCEIVYLFSNHISGLAEHISCADAGLFTKPGWFVFYKAIY
ncbi:hypothetical protein GLOIN_2v1820882 [Rhizophagus irregularis DAOM 181602=DAOM 197198]|uniref:Uncharacterized protein n=1 Tax=Rhizophagus irregularis (strain DAOM 181602 / DAOM 197198 / MUCL 43194) TaxID=747089 RepID=A0A2P4QFC6_RHIID|nr:hypothetical protein GLOIN_2v1820882 [Rhizophagus irregularis DAOM 181602=DAOM 197198]POG76317.1 hypothetical protein GLOIN_2v1820882 [Rhizophagus irregularis DAOM 181602=DAOM 197198]|eukprot:XP_025183183.1 hypothetical protein GLOIN_2v1820882 [Rhizophagus irregularis DAOM 181602=DAOM 197198]